MTERLNMNINLRRSGMTWPVAEIGFFAVMILLAGLAG
jgi:hypothetical protein